MADGKTFRAYVDVTVRMYTGGRYGEDWSIKELHDRAHRDAEALAYKMCNVKTEDATFKLVRVGPTMTIEVEK